MKNHLKLHLILIYFVAFITCKRFYDVLLDDVSADTEHINQFINWNLYLDKDDSSRNVMSGQIVLKQDIPNETIVHMSGYEKRGNIYHPSVIDSVFNICDFLNESHVENIFLNQSNFPRDCPVIKGNYSVNQMFISSENLPKEISGKDWMLRFHILLGDDTLGGVKIYATIIRHNQ